MAAFALNSALAMEIADIDGGAGAFFAFQNTLIGMSTMANVILVGAVSALAIRTKFLPDWLAYGGVAISLVQLVGALTIASDSQGLARLGSIAFLLWLVWIVSIALVVSRQEPSPTPA